MRYRSNDVSFSFTTENSDNVGVLVEVWCAYQQDDIFVKAAELKYKIKIVLFKKNTILMIVIFYLQ